MIRFPNAKINLGLRIVARRPDGYHNIETVFYPIQLQDALEIVPTSQQETELSLSGIVIDGDPQNNLVMKAWRRLSCRFSLPPISIYLHKAIPFGAGLGGGSSDAAFLLAMVRDYRIVLVKPSVSVPTSVAYSLVTPVLPEEPVRDTVSRPVEEWRGRLINDFEESVFARFPEIGEIKDRLYEQGAVYASMSGSGSSVFALFDKEVDLADCYPGCFVWTGICEV